jgi:hypothetical protein
VIDSLVQSFRDLADSIVQAAPKVVIGIVLILVAWIVAKVIEKVLRIILVRVRFDSLVEKAGIDKTLQRAGIRQQLNVFIPRIVYFLLLVLFAKAAADALGLAAISDALASFFSYLPNIIAALLLLVIGSAAAQFVGQTITQAAEESGIDFAPALGRVVSGLILFIIGIMAITQLKIDTDMIRLVTTLLLAGAAIAFGLSFGLGSRDLTRNIIAGFYARRVLDVGASVEIGELRGVLKAITTTHTLIESDGRTVSVSNSAFLDQVSKQ